ncbi:hypothetical protein ACP70R_002808 [Stipagrostis hirtigluma subsp. patula]
MPSSRGYAPGASHWCGIFSWHGDASAGRLLRRAPETGDVRRRREGSELVLPAAKSIDGCAPLYEVNRESHGVQRLRSSGSTSCESRM